MRYYIRQQKTIVSGPHDLDHIKLWIREGKVRPNMEFSPDEIDWQIGVEVPELFPSERSHRRARVRSNRHRRIHR